MADTKPGVETTEYALAREAGVVGTLTLVLGIIVAVGGAVLEAVELPGQVAAVIGVVVAASGAALKAIASAGYGFSRAAVKAAASMEPKR